MKCENCKKNLKTKSLLCPQCEKILTNLKVEYDKLELRLTPYDKGGYIIVSKSVTPNDFDIRDYGSYSLEELKDMLISAKETIKFDLQEELQNLINNNNNLEYNEYIIQDGDIIFEGKVMDLKAMDNKELKTEIQALKDNI